MNRQQYHHRYLTKKEEIITYFSGLFDQANPKADYFNRLQQDFFWHLIDYGELFISYDDVFHEISLYQIVRKEGISLIPSVLYVYRIYNEGFTLITPNVYSSQKVRNGVNGIYIRWNVKALPFDRIWKYELEKIIDLEDVLFTNALFSMKKLILRNKNIRKDPNEYLNKILDPTTPIVTIDTYDPTGESGFRLEPLNLPETSTLTAFNTLISYRNYVFNAKGYATPIFHKNVSKSVTESNSDYINAGVRELQIKDTLDEFALSFNRLYPNLEPLSFVWNDKITLVNNAKKDAESFNEQSFGKFDEDKV